MSWLPVLAATIAPANNAGAGVLTLIVPLGLLAIVLIWFWLARRQRF
jgi:hypothetical protein